MTVSSKTSSFRKGLSAVVLAVAFASASVAVPSSAQAHFYHHHHWGHHGWGHHGWGYGGWGPGLGVGIGLGLLSAAVAADSGPSCYWQSEYNRYGHYLGRVRICE